MDGKSMEGKLKNRTSPLSVVAIICSTRRPQILHETLMSIQGLEPGVSSVLLSVAADSDVLQESLGLPRVKRVIAPRGSASQRNAALRSLESAPDFIVFLDDDIEIAPNHIEAYAECFQSDQSIVLATAVDLQPGITNIPREDARIMIEGRDLSDQDTTHYPDCYTAYGASMAFRGTLAGQVWFDENLPLYSFMEDYDFTLSCRAFGRCVKVPSAKYVHLEPSAGRVSNLLRGYSEVVNPFYIARKHRMGFRARIILGCLRRTAQSIKSIPKDGSTRFRGHVKGWTDVLLRKSDPRKILEM
jgi:GT2 family glycosyltransferase